MNNFKKISIIFVIITLIIFAIGSWIDLDDRKLFIVEDDFFIQYRKAEALINKLKIARKINSEYQQNLQILKVNKSSLWNKERDGRVESNMRSIIKKLANECKVNFKSIGKLRQSENKLGFVTYEISISGNCTSDAIVKFCQQLTEQEVKFRWITLSISNNYNFGRKNLKPNVMVQGVLAVLAITDEKLLKAISSKNKLGVKK